MQQSSGDSWITSTWLDFVCLLLLAIAVVLLFETSPRAGDFWWSDAPRHAMDGVFYYDLVRSLPVSNLKQWAMDYYVQYPAVTVLFYLPVFALIEAIFFALFGVSHNTAQLTVSAFLLALACGTYFLARRWLGRVAAFSTALLFIGTPAVALWGRQVMLEIPAFAFLLWSSYFFLLYVDSAQPRTLYLATGFLLAAIYTKQSTVFLVPVCLLTLYSLHQREIFRRKELRWSAVMFCLGLVPLAIFTWLWGQLNVKQVTGGSWADHPRTALSGWLFVARQWPHQLGWIVLTLAAVYCVAVVFQKKWRLPRTGMVFLLAWLITGYLFFTLIAIKLERHAILLILPFVFFAILALDRILPAKVAPVATIVLALGIFIHTLAREHVPVVSGYRAAAQYVCSVAPPNSVVLFSGRRDGSFIFDVRATPACKNLTVIRADKLLLLLRGNRYLFGVKELGVTDSQFLGMLQQYGVRYVVVQPNFWKDLQSMQMLDRVIHGDQFKLLTTVHLVGDQEPDETELEIYQNLTPVSQQKNPIRFDLPAFGITIKGTVGGEK
jgi:4-amino-4-deoxy-L-arabinose transferase-like glycosyltransferase